MRFLLLLTFATKALAAGLGSYADLVVADSRETTRDGVRVTYLGTNGYQFEFKGHSLFVDPYFSRVDLLSVALGARIQPNASRINDGLRRLVSKPDAILVTHGHFDHLLDVPFIMATTGARLIASSSSVDLVRRLPDAWAAVGDADRPVPPSCAWRCRAPRIRADIAVAAARASLWSPLVDAPVVWKEAMRDAGCVVVGSNDLALRVD